MRINPAARLAVFVPSMFSNDQNWTQNNTGIASLPDGSNATNIAPHQVISKGVDITKTIDGTVNVDFPPSSWLGFGIDLTTVTPVDITSVASSVIKQSRVIQLQAGGVKKNLGGGLTWLVPPGVNADPNLSSGKTSYYSFKSGDDAAYAIGVDSSLAANYLSVSGGLAASYAVQKTFQKTFQYYMMVHNQMLVSAGFEDYGSAVDELMLKARLSRIPRFDPYTLSIVEQYKSLFATLGTHIITGVNYGGRFQLHAWADNTDSTVNQEFGADISAEFNGITSGGKVDINVKASEQYHKFEQSVQKTCSCQGGDPDLGNFLGGNPGGGDNPFETFEEWVKTADTRPMVMSFETAPLWDMVSAANDSELAVRSPDLKKAYSWIVENPEQHLTPARLSITSDWGEIGILTPSAYIVKDPKQGPVPGAQVGTTKITWDGTGGGAARDLHIE
ncbi:MAG: hypothetical protein Q9208_006641 [Pyrenodesmia sp. 3 TL-2023]